RDMFNVPAVAFEALAYIFGEGHVRQAVQRDVVLVVDPAKIGKLQMAGQRRGLAADAFHQVAIAAQRVDVEVKNLKTGLVEMRCQPLAGNRHTDAVSHTLPEWPGGVSTPAVQRYSGCPGVLLSSWRKCLRSSIETARSPRRSPSGFTPRTCDRYSMAYNNMEAWPFERIKRSRLGHVGFSGS